MTRSLSLLYTLGWFIGWLAVAALVAALVATGFGETRAFTAFLNTSGLSLFVAIALIFAFRGNTDQTYRRRHGLVLMGLTWIALPLFGALPFITLMDLNGVVGYFEAVSMFTTTGASTTASVDELPRSLIFWRASLQWLGGALTIVFATAALERGRVGADQGVRLMSGALANRGRLASVARQVMPLYLLLTTISFVALWLTGVASFDAVAWSMSIISTGGGAVRDGAIADFGNVATALVFVVFMGLGSLNLLTLTAWLERGRFRTGASARALKSIAKMVALVIGVIIVGVVLLGRGEGVGFWQATIGGLFNAVSMFSTTGYFYDMETMAILPLPLLITLVLIGGSYGSTSGGMKIGRVAQMLGDANRELEHLIHPNAVVVDEEGAGGESNRVIWSYLAAYLMGMVLTAGLLGAGGMEFDSALAGAAAMLANVGPLIDLMGSLPDQATVSLADLPDGVLLGLSAAMVLGRIEILAALSILIPVFWTR